VARDAGALGVRASSPRQSFGRTGFRPLAVARIDRLCNDAVAITFDVPPDLAGEYRFQPGQSVTVRRLVDGCDQRRSYSICSAPGRPLRIGVREVADGAVSPWLVRGVSPGELVEVQPPSGSFVADPGTPARHGLIAAGSGITPILSIASSVLPDPSAQVTLLYGNRRVDSVMFSDELADIKDSFPTRFQLVHVLSREAQEVDLFSGRMDAAKLRQLLPAVCDVESVDHWWLCGPSGMVTGAVGVLTELGVEPGRVRRELFYVEDLPPPPNVHHENAPAGGCDLTVVLDGRSTSMKVPGDTPLLDGAQRARPDLPFACKGGVCGTCRARVVKGEVRMRRNFALEPGEIDAGLVLTCQSLPLTEEVVVDFDI
jgi:ring-1,2-phenylacetyl-CoA epoxidase subunit PaaE